MSRKRRIASKVASIVDNAIMEAVNDLLTLVGPNKASTEEIAHAVRFYPDFAEDWRQALDEDYDDNGDPIETVEPSVPQDHRYEQGTLFDYVNPNEEVSDD